MTPSSISRMKEHRFSLRFPSFGCRGSQFSVKHLARSDIAHVQVRMNSKTLRSAETWTEIARLFARLALKASFLSAVADRFGLWGPYGAKNVSWGNFAHFLEYTRSVTYASSQALRNSADALRQLYTDFRSHLAIWAAAETGMPPPQLHKELLACCLHIRFTEPTACRQRR